MLFIKNILIFEALYTLLKILNVRQRKPGPLVKLSSRLKLGAKIEQWKSKHEHKHRSWSIGIELIGRRLGWPSTSLDPKIETGVKTWGETWCWHSQKPITQILYQERRRQWGKSGTGKKSKNEQKKDEETQEYSWTT